MSKLNILTSDQLQRWKDDGYLLIPDFFSPKEVKEMLDEATRLCDEFDIEGHPMTTFKTAADGEHVGDDYFLNSNDKIRYFLEPTSITQPTPDTPAKLLVEPSKSINKIGHALAVLNPVFHRYTLENENIKNVARDLGEQKDPRVLQSMIICKQPKIGGVVPCHNDSTFLYTDPPSAIGCWIALEDCTPSNGCLSFYPGSHKKVRISERFIRDPSGKGTTFIDLPDVPKNEENWDEMDGWQEASCKAGTLVLIHGSVMHKSPPNHSDKTRFIYTFHMIEGDGAVFDKQNWLQPTPEMPFQPLFSGW
ncbi:uncharacterized protein I303_107216 [Kwoniella dejecticola CBS 10117]|uniref:Phytanoyl-CoA dioxygenase n=1 Tax=Kwoniella dejecticola CBS 10117 TaxID=1296121 RepID=A0A1A5ZZ22_9TREE|nr:phytanoyl-CoA dioxygenase [Kwoniella dejecticola CBS 10117]OBR83058.1 phytanoyl-CoA dioxygenase [Kwoniella dejecticola CBS 10117]